VQLTLQEVSVLLALVETLRDTADRSPDVVRLAETTAEMLKERAEAVQRQPEA
jgi:hypothetical protein